MERINSMTSTDINNHIIIVTGAASGIGRQIAIRLAEAGAIVAACDKNISALQEIVNDKIRAFEVDFTSEESINTCVKNIE